MLAVPKRHCHPLAAANTVSLAVAEPVALLHTAAGGDVRAYGSADDSHPPRRRRNRRRRSRRPMASSRT